ncbi:hypothetical protein [Luteimicrobium sp. DT211]|uniref:hypothetical protein n=1 Tax=Luteimicrobium sp. DT211 TaxID=3393412 RepID=UPI003CFB6650
MSGTDPTTPHPTPSGAPSSQPPAPPASVPPARTPTPAVHVGGRDQSAPDDAPTSLMPPVRLSAPSPDPTPAPPAPDAADATRVAAPLRHGEADVDATQFLPPAAAPATAASAPVPTRTPSYSTRRPPVTPPAGPYGGLYAGPLSVPGQTPASPDPQATQVAAQGPVPPPPVPTAAVRPSSAPQAPAFTAPTPGPSAPVPEPVAYPAAAPREPASAAPRSSGGRLGGIEPRVAVLGGVVGVLVVVAVVLGFTLFGGSGSPATTPSAGASASAGAGEQPVVTERFAAPSRNISCTMTATEARCSIAQLTTKPAPVDGCDGTVGYVVTLGADGAVDTPCVAAQDQPRAASSKLETLAYGKSVTMGKLTCSSSETGVECRTKGTGKGFSIARVGVRVL